jgi:hypothetical protein
MHLCKLVTNILPKPSIEDKIKSLQDAEVISFANGLTTVSVAGLDREDIFLIDSLHKGSDCSRCSVYAMVSNTPRKFRIFPQRRALQNR